MMFLNVFEKALFVIYYYSTSEWLVVVPYTLETYKFRTIKFDNIKTMDETVSAHLLLTGRGR